MFALHFFSLGICEALDGHAERENGLRDGALFKALDASVVESNDASGHGGYAVDINVGGSKLSFERIVVKIMSSKDTVDA